MLISFVLRLIHLVFSLNYKSLSTDILKLSFNISYGSHPCFLHLLTPTYLCIMSHSSTCGIELKQTIEAKCQEALDQFKVFYESSNLPDTISSFSMVLKALDLETDSFPIFFPKLKGRLQPSLAHKYKSIWDTLTIKGNLKVYGTGIASKYSVLVVGAGPCGLRTAIETQLLGARTVIVEGRKDFTRNNVLKLWRFVIEDLKSLGFKSFYGQFCTGSINHVSIRNLQLVLCKICLMLGVKIVSPVMFRDLCYPEGTGKGWTASFTPDSYELKKHKFDMLVIASGKKVPLKGFDRQSLNAKLSIAITGNFVNNRTEEEQSVEEISGLSKQYNQAFFKDIENDEGISLENIVYYKGETHYFVMTATRDSLLKRGVLLQNVGDRESLMKSTNINRGNLYKYVNDVAEYSTNYLSKRLPRTGFAMDHSGNPDVAVFDFTNLYSASHAGELKECQGHTLILAAVGDSLLEPFWPEGTGCARGFLSAMNAAWMLRRLAEGKNSDDILSEREHFYKLLKQTSDDELGVLKADITSYTIDPRTRYKVLPQSIDKRDTQTSYRKPSFLILESANVNLNTTISVRQQKVSHDISLVLSFLPLNFGRTRVVCLVSQR